jgi:hypothetical protein
MTVAVSVAVAVAVAASRRRDRGMATVDEVRAMTWRLLNPRG